MATQTLIWTVLPNGIRDGKLQLSLLVSPRLSPTGTLKDFSLGNWPKRIGQLVLGVEFAGGPTLPLQVKTDLLSDQAWANLFPDSFPVRGHELPNTASRPIKSFPVERIHKYIRTLYSAIASDPESVKNQATLKEGPVGELINTVGRLDEIICGVVNPVFTNTATVGVPQASQFVCRPDDEQIILRKLGDGLVRDFFQAWRFYNRGNQEPVAYHGQTPPPIPPLVEIPKFDFHDAVAMLGDHPHLLRMLGLVIDAEVDLGRNQIPVPPVSRIALRVLQGEVPVGESHNTPWTHYGFEAKNAIFAALPKGAGSDLGFGYLRLGKKGAYEVMQVDLDGAALNVMTFATNQRRFQVKALLDEPKPQGRCEPPTPIAPNRGTLPALQTGGFTIARNARRDRVQARLVDAVSHNGLMNDAAFYADDLLRGYRVDVQHEGKWLSLCRRVATYNVPGMEPFKVVDEGYVKGSTVSSNPNGGATSEIYLHEAVFGWSGWSLVASRPGRTLSMEIDKSDRTQVHKVTDRPIRNAPPAEVPLKLEPEVKAEPRTLPRLRFGRKYRFRARSVDLAGNSVALDHVPNVVGDIISDEQTYLRFEPVAPPALAFREAITLGEQMEAMVIRTKMNAPDVATDLLPAELFNPQNERHVVPPKTSQASVEAHGMLDGYADPKASYRVSIKEYGTLQDRQVIDENTGEYVDVSSSMELLATPEYEPEPGEPPLKWPDAEESIKRGQYVVHKGDEIRLPYLPDPVAVGAAFWGEHRGTAMKVLAPYEGAFPSPRTLRVVLTPGGGVDIGGPDGNVIRAKMPPGSILKLRFASVPAAHRLEHFAIWADMTAAGKAALKTEALEGRHWMLTPSRELTLIHAVERPVTAPVLDVAAVDEEGKARGQTFSELAGRVQNHSGSTGHLALEASWTEWEDRLDDNAEGVTKETRGGHVIDLKVAYGEDVRSFPNVCEERPRHEFGDTKHRRIRYHAVGTTRFLENFPLELAQRKDLISLAGPDAAEVNILSTARPEPPRVLYIVPTFGWETSADGKTQKRVGRGLRVYLDRPWYTTGEGERLAAIVGPPPPPVITHVPPPPPESLRRYLSEWGSDPVHAGPVPNANTDLHPGHFTNADKVVKAGLTLDELGDDPAQTVQAVGFNVEFNPERQLWFCDIQMDSGKAYFPYVRLSLARFQPDSIPNAHLSRLVRTEFAQLVADRTATISRRAGGFIDLTVWGVSAPTHLGLRLPPRPEPKLPPGQVKKLDVKQGAQTVQPPVTQVPIGQLPEVNLPPVQPPVLGPPFVLPLPSKNPTAGAGHSVRAHVERRTAGTTGDLGWERDSDDFELESHTYLLAPGEVFWIGTVQGPARPLANSEYRLVIREFELYDADSQVAEKNSPVYNPRKVPMGERLVYLDVFPLG